MQRATSLLKYTDEKSEKVQLIKEVQTYKYLDAWDWGTLHKENQAYLVNN